MTDMDSQQLGRHLRHLIIDYVGGADTEHLIDLCTEALAESPKQAYLSILLTCTAASQLVAAVVTPQLSDDADPFWGLEVAPHPGVDMADPVVRGKVAAAQAITAQLNDDRETAAALIGALVNADDGPELTAPALHAALEIISSIAHTPEGLDAMTSLGIR